MVLCSQEDKTPFDLAVEKQFTEIARMIGDYRERRAKGLEKYEQPKKTSSGELSAKPSGDQTPSSSHGSSKRGTTEIQWTLFEMCMRVMSE